MQSDYDLKETIAKLIYRMKAVPEDSAAHRLIVRELEGLLVTKWRSRSWRTTAFHEPSPRRSKNGARADPTPSPRGPGPANVAVPRPDKPYAML